MNAKRSVLLVGLILALLVVALIMPSVAQAKHPKNTIIVGTNPYYPPFENLKKNGKIIGFDIALVKEIGKRTGYKIEFKAEEWEKLIIPGLTGQPPAFDMVASALTITPEREDVIDFSDAYFYDEVYDSYYGFGFPAGSLLRLEVNGALQEIKEDGTYTRLYRKWFGAAPLVIP